MNRGVGIDRDKVVFRAGELDPEVRQASERFNRSLLYAHSAGIGPEAPEAHVRAAMLARLNAMLFGATGVQPAVVQMYVEFLNRRIHQYSRRAGRSVKPTSTSSRTSASR